MKKIKKDFWEKIFTYPSFNLRFGFTIGIVIIFFLILTYFVIFRLRSVQGISESIAFLNLIVQATILLLAIFAAYYALRQLVETRFTSLDEAGMEEYKRKHYSRAFNKWREAFYIRPEVSILENLCESLLLMQDYDTFDEYMRISQFKKEIFQEPFDQIILLYLKSLRNLLVKNQGEAEKYLSELISLTSQGDVLSSFQWDFLDLQTSTSYLNLIGECKDISENLILYLSKGMSSKRKSDFEAKKFSSHVD